MKPKVVTTRDLIRDVAARWRRQYKFTLTEEGRRAAVTRWKEEKYDIALKLDAINGETATAAEVDAIIGNAGWTMQSCDGCGESVDKLVVVGAEPNCDSSTARLCQKCLDKAVAAMKGI